MVEGNDWGYSYVYFSLNFTYLSPKRWQPPRLFLRYSSTVIPAAGSQSNWEGREEHEGEANTPSLLSSDMPLYLQYNKKHHPSTDQSVPFFFMNV